MTKIGMRVEALQPPGARRVTVYMVVDSGRAVGFAHVVQDNPSGGDHE
jgi:hypothetical protein